ncbi:TonB-dependent receptor domain-containing protein [Pseudoduganella violacea]|uniref:Hemoglobin/transferrin/lactoferrin receptor protein n=1 Tax=Pseudoduganella violacea TaxID=1715466 RepID=A0A7W5B6W6_9BURK|nr:TonB-dependent receptor [Pseudoduganella violacea]MBB3117647.1 hemoglobin/transferrin/lactoferrin receptor protein [Pseudoduganella violacea]
MPAFPRPHRLAVLLLTAFSPVALAQTAAPASQLGEILVTAKRDEAASARTGTNTKLTAEDLTKRAVTDMAGMARYEPLISVPLAASGSGNIWDGAGNTGFNIRGVEGNRVSLDLDGIALPDAAPKPDATTLGSFGIGRDYFDPETFREVRIGSGTSAAGAGTPGLGGSVSFVTKSPEDFVSAQRPTYAEYKFGYTGVDKAKMHALTGAVQSGAVKAMALYVHRKGEQQRSEGDVAQNPDDWSSDALLAKFSWTPLAGHKLGFTFDGYRNEHERRFINKLSTNYPQGALQTSKTRRNRLSADHEMRGRSWFDTLESRIYVQDSKVDDHTNARYTFGSPADRSIDTGYYNKSVGLASNASKQLNAQLLLNYGLSFENTESRRPWREDRTILATGAHQITRKNRMADVDTRKLAAYVRAELGFELGGYKSALTPGLRAEHQQMKPKNLQNYAIAVPNAAKELGKQDYSYLTPSLNLSVYLKPELSVYLQYHRGTRIPTAIEQTGTFDSFSYTGAGQGYAVLGNSNLKKETSDAFELGLKGEAAKGVQLSASVFNTRYKNFIEYAPQADDPVNYPTLTSGLYRPENMGKARTWGAEASVRLDLGAFSAPLNGFSVDLAAGVAKGRSQDKETGKKSDLASALPAKFTTTLAWDDPAKRGGAALSAVHARGRQAESSITDPRSGKILQMFDVPASTVLDLTGYWNIGKNATINAGIYNLGDRKYWDYAQARALAASAKADIERYARPGRTAAVSFKLMY